MSKLIINLLSIPSVEYRVIVRGYKCFFTRDRACPYNRELIEAEPYDSILISVKPDSDKPISSIRILSQFHGYISWERIGYINMAGLNKELIETGTCTITIKYNLRVYDEFVKIVNIN